MDFWHWFRHIHGESNGLQVRSAIILAKAGASPFLFTSLGHLPDLCFLSFCHGHGKHSRWRHFLSRRGLLRERRRGLQKLDLVCLRRSSLTAKPTLGGSLASRPWNDSKTELKSMAGGEPLSEPRNSRRYFLGRFLPEYLPCQHRRLGNKFGRWLPGPGRRTFHLGRSLCCGGHGRHLGFFDSF